MAGFVKISEACSLALHAVSYLASFCRDRPCTTRDMASHMGVSEHHLAKVLQRLARAKLLKSTRGPSGGFKLARPAEELTLMEVVEAVEGPYRPTTCLFEVPICKGDGCIFGNLLVDLDEMVVSYLRSTRVSQVRDILPPPVRKPDLQGRSKDAAG